MFNRHAFAMAMAALAAGGIQSVPPGLIGYTKPHLIGERRKTLYYYHHPRAHNAGSHPVPGGGLRERHRRMVRGMLAEWKL